MSTTKHEWSISLGNPYDGITLIGPFPTVNNATLYAQENIDHKGKRWCIVKLETPDWPA